ncbi:YfkD family protein [Thalassorhabdus alkalitolerans]|uniref:YfkD family protein n=1 Tax=Thalassorhabdus alkalitolerans TaxID=2282697 RepID=A0ABW0YT35_9BACI|nr:YfkD family protein [Thalassobacillus sp. C254]
MKIWVLRLIVVLLILILPVSGAALAEESEKADDKPDYVFDISKENTFSSSTKDEPFLHPSSLSKELIETSNVPVMNPELIRILNETTIDGSKFAFGFKASIFLGEWALCYEGESSEANWEYEKVNTNSFDNRGGNETFALKYKQDQAKRVKGEITADIPDGDEVKKMMVLHAAKETKLPVAMETTIGNGTELDHAYRVNGGQSGSLHGYVPAVKEKGSVTYGEVYLVLRGGKQMIEVKNVTQQDVQAWLPVQNHLSLKFIPGN